MTITREQCLDKAKECVLKDRNSTYGSPEDSFQKVASLWEAYKGTPFTPKDVALMLALLKVGRLSANPTHDDSWIDLAGYAACGSELGNSKGVNAKELIQEAEDNLDNGTGALREKQLKEDIVSLKKLVEDSLQDNPWIKTWPDREIKYPWDNPVMCGPLGTWRI